MMTYPTRRARAKSRSSLVWTLGLLLASQAALGLWIHRAHPELCDAAWNFRLERLQARLAEAAGRPLFLVLGSSRPANGVCPQAMGEWAPPGTPRPVVFNFATLGGGPVRELLTLRRLLAQGIKPRWVLAEFCPLFWADRGRYEEREPILSAECHLSDLAVLSHVYQQRVEAVSKVACRNLTPALYYRGGVLARYAMCLMPRHAEHDQNWGQVHWNALDDWGWLPVCWPRRPPAEFAQNLEIARQDTMAYMDHVRPRPHLDWTVRQLIQTCRQEDIRLVFFLMPEHSAVRNWFPPRVRTFLHRYLCGLQDEFGLEVIDTRDWVSDEGFVDFCHLLPCGARPYSARLGQEVLRPLLKGKPLPAQARLRAPGATTPAEGRSPGLGI